MGIHELRQAKGTAHAAKWNGAPADCGVVGDVVVCVPQNLLSISGHGKLEPRSGRPSEPFILLCVGKLRSGDVKRF